MGGFAWVTLATNDSYSLGALVLAHSLKQAGTTQQLAVLVTPGVTQAMREKLSQVFNLVQEVNILDSKDEANLRLLKRPELGITFTKLHCWRLTQYDKCVFLDADTLVLQNCDELFEREELSAAPDVGWPDCFNSGVFVYRPSNDTYENLIQFALEKGSFDGGDQGLLNLYFSDWAHKDISKHLPFIYNLCSTACYSYLPAFKQFGANAKIIHFIGATKPWLQYFNTETRQVQPSSDSVHLREVLQRWWNIFCSLIHPNLSPEMNRSGTDNTHTHGSPSHFPHNTSYEFENTSSYNPADDYQNVWDPWDEYDQKQANIQASTHVFSAPHYEANQPIEPLNTNACIFEANQEHIHHHHGGDEGVQCIPYVQSQPHSSFHNPGHSYTPNEPEPPHVHTNPSETPSHHHQPHETHFHQPETHFHQPETHFHPPETHFHQPETHFHHQPIEVFHHHQSYEQPVEQSHNEYKDNHSNDNHHSSHNEPNSNVERLDFPQTHDTEQNHTHVYHQPYHEPEKPIPIQEISPPLESSKPTTPPVLPKECEVICIDSNSTYLYSSTKEDDSCSNNDAGLAGAFAQLTLGVPRTSEQEALESHLRRQAWEVGNIDYLGRDSFENIWTKILDTLSQATEPEPTPTPILEPAAPVEQPTAPTAQPPTEVQPQQPQPEAQPSPTPVESKPSQDSPVQESPVQPPVAEPTPVVPSPAEPVSVVPTAEPAQVVPTPAEPAPVVPTPVEPASAEPSPAVPTPAEPAIATPAPVEPAPATPTPVEPAPATPTSVEPAPATPAPVEPAPATPTPVEPAPATPAPVEPAPASPAPAEPTPLTPAPVEPVPTPAEPVESAPALVESTPAAPAPVEPSPATPTPVPTPSTPVESVPAPSTPSPAVPTPTEPAPATPTPAPVATTPAEPVSPSPVPVSPAPAPAEPTPTTPKPAEPLVSAPAAVPTPAAEPAPVVPTPAAAPVVPTPAEQVPSTPTPKQAEPVIEAVSTPPPVESKTTPPVEKPAPKAATPASPEPATKPVPSSEVAAAKAKEPAPSDPKTPEALVCPIKPAKGAGEPATPVEQPKEAKQATPPETPPAESGSGSSQPQAPPRKVVKKSGTKKAKN